MLHQKISDDYGSASVEFTLLVSLFVAPTLLVAQQLTQVQLRQASVESIAQTLARDFSLNRDLSRLSTLANQLSDDAGMQADLLVWQLDCDAKSSCESEAGTGAGAGTGETLTITVSYRDVRARSMQILDEQGSILPLLLAGFALVFSVIAIGVNLQAAQLFDQRAQNLARFLVHKTIGESPGVAGQDITALANQTSKSMMFSSQPVESATLQSPDGKTHVVKVCLGFTSPIQMISLPVSHACAASSMRQLAG